MIEPEKIIAWGQRIEPKKGELIVTLDGNTWVAPITMEVVPIDAGSGIKLLLNEAAYYQAIKRGIYLGDGLVNSVTIPKTNN